MRYLCNPPPSSAGLTPLLEAASAGHAKCVNMLQNADPECNLDANHTFPKSSPTEMRPKTPSMRLCDLPLSCTRGRRAGLTPLLEAAAAGHAKCVNMLQNADPEAADDVDPSGNTALHLASQVLA